MLMQLNQKPRKISSVLIYWFLHCMFFLYQNYVTYKVFVVLNCDLYIKYVLLITWFCWSIMGLQYALHPSVCVSVRLYVRLFVHLSVRLSVLPFVCPSVCTSVRPSDCSSVCPVPTFDSKKENLIINLEDRLPTSWVTAWQSKFEGGPHIVSAWAVLSHWLAYFDFLCLLIYLFFV